jgi:hypothetical protein
VLSEDDLERNRHDALTRTILNTPGRAIPLRRLFALRDYPKNDVMALYAEGYSVSNFLVGQSNRQAFLAFVNTGMRNGWDDAAQRHYGYKNVDALEQAWLQNLRDTKRQPGTTLASGRGDLSAEPTSRVVTRQTVPPAQPLAPDMQPVVRGQAPSDLDRYDSRGRPQYLPEYRSPNASSSQVAPNWSSPGGGSSVRLSAPVADVQTSSGVQLGQPILVPIPGK